MCKFECPFSEYKNISCDFMGIRHEESAVQCPTQIFNKCQSDTALSEEDKHVIEDTQRILKEKEALV